MPSSNKGAVKFAIDISIYNVNIIVVLGNKKHINKFLKKIGIKINIDTSILEGAAGYTMMLEGCVLLWMRRKPPYNSFDSGCLAHEIFHCTSFILSRAGVKLCDKSEEAYAYLNGHIHEVINDKLQSLEAAK